MSSQKSRGKRGFNSRLGRIATSIVSRKIGVVGLQELSPGAKGKRPTDRLVRALRRAGGTYAMVRTSPYFPAGTKKVGSQGARIVYDSSRYALVSSCPNSTGNRQYSSSCAIEMPPGPGEKHGRMAAIAQFRDRATGARFWFVSVHLTPLAGVKRDRLRTRQVKHVVSQIEKRNVAKLPIVLVGDLNTWRNRSTGRNAHDFLAKRGFVDSFTAKKRKNAKFSTYNQWGKRVKKGARLDYVLVKNGAGVLRYRNVMKRVDAKRPSDHNLVIGDVRLPAPR
ncbi:MAG: hypothetical protein M3Y20_08100 [Actinomycetota bacterium]|nr:hypothetical protein [Actinomycetota bacterium]